MNLEKKIILLTNIKHHKIFKIKIANKLYYNIKLIVFMIMNNKIQMIFK
jgi:hypothetical protein